MYSIDMNKLHFYFEISNNGGLTYVSYESLQWYSTQQVRCVYKSMQYRYVSKSTIFLEGIAVGLKIRNRKCHLTIKLKNNKLI